MGAELGGVEGRMRGTVIRGEDIEMVLAAVPEQVWLWDDGEFEGGDVVVPMRVRREIIAHVLGVVQRGT